MDSGDRVKSLLCSVLGGVRCPFHDHSWDEFVLEFDRLLNPINPPRRKGSHLEVMFALLVSDLVASRLHSSATLTEFGRHGLQLILTAKERELFKQKMEADWGATVGRLVYKWRTENLFQDVLKLSCAGLRDLLKARSDSYVSSMNELIRMRRKAMLQDGSLLLELLGSELLELFGIVMNLLERNRAKMPIHSPSDFLLVQSMRTAWLWCSIDRPIGMWRI